MEDIIPNFSYNNFLHDNFDMLFNSYYDSSYDGSDLLSDMFHNSLPSDPIFELYNFSHDSYDSSRTPDISYISHIWVFTDSAKFSLKS
jgi:hypothetical protein